jgi:hypothetical protein
MVPEDLLFWVDALQTDGHAGVLCRRHADAMVVPRGWTLDDRREPQPRLFRSPADASGSIARPTRRRSIGSASRVRERVEQLELEAARTGAVTDNENDTDESSPPWAPVFDAADDLDGLLHVDSPLLARAFRGRAR